MIIAALEARGFSLHEISRASQQHKQVGVYFDGVARVFNAMTLAGCGEFILLFASFKWVEHDPWLYVF